jgi:tRNA-splicing ligase RtcB (3'-phosphate/5'-hydroxy nucleic acid ligase)
MNARQLARLGVPELCASVAIAMVQDMAKYNRTVDREARINIKDAITKVVSDPDSYKNDERYGSLAEALIEDRDFVRPEPIAYQTWGADGIDQGSHEQMKQACSMPNAVGAALMPDAHVGYGLPIGGVLALDNAVAPYAVGVDIACRMKMSVLDMGVDRLKKAAGFDRGRDFDLFEQSIERGTVFGVGANYQKPQEHAVMDKDWSITRITRESQDKAWRQLGTSGSGNHFVEFGVFTLVENDDELGLEAGEYIALMSHSGSRGTGAAVCSTYSRIAQARLSSRYDDLGSNEPHG